MRVSSNGWTPKFLGRKPRNREAEKPNAEVPVFPTDTGLAQVPLTTGN